MKKIKIILGGLVLLAVLAFFGTWLYVQFADYSFARSVSQEEEAIRLQLVEQAESWLGRRESDGSHRVIIDTYNAHEPLARGYAVQYTDNWCAAFVSAAAIACEMTDIIPTECGCQKQIELFQALDRWVEDDSYVPLPGDIIYYCGNDRGLDDCTAWSDHVGIVVGTNGSFIKVIEGNRNDSVSYRILPIDSPGIRGFGIPAYAPEE